MIRTWQGNSNLDCGSRGISYCLPATADSYAAYPGVTCRDDVYVDGQLNRTKPCSSDIGRGSAKAVSGCCLLFDGRVDQCGDEPFLTLEEGVCDEQAQITEFICVSFGFALYVWCVDEC